VKGLVDPENISHNADYDQHLSSASPPIPPSENETVEFESRKRRHLEHNRHIIATDKYEDNESDTVHRDFDSMNDIDNRTDLSPPLNDLSRKRRKDSNCDSPLLPQPNRLSRGHSESRVSIKYIVHILKKNSLSLYIFRKESFFFSCQNFILATLSSSPQYIKRQI
jgi:hypothetical protein